MAKFSVGQRVRVRGPAYFPEYGLNSEHIAGDRQSSWCHGMKAIVQKHEGREVYLFKENHTRLFVVDQRQCRRLKPRKPKEVKPIDWAKDAFDCLNHGVELMPVKQLSRWIGVRAVIESYPEGSRVISKADLEKSWDICGPSLLACESGFFKQFCKAIGFESEGK